AVWFVFYALVDTTYLPRYISRLHEASHFVSAELNRDLFFAVLRIILHLAAALAIIQYAEWLLSWLVKDLVGRSPNSTSDSTAAPKVSQDGSKVPEGGGAGSV